MPKLPLEVELYIVELAIPPFTWHGRDERRELCKTLSLVHRSWTDVAQKRLREVLVKDLSKVTTSHDFEALTEELDRLSPEAFSETTGLAVQMSYVFLERPYDSYDESVIEILSGYVASRVREIWVHWCRLPPAWISQFDVECLHLIGSFHSKPRPLQPNLLLPSLSALTYLHIDCAMINTLPVLDNLDTFLLSYITPWQSFSNALFKSLPNVRVVGLHDLAPFFTEAAFQSAPSTLEHVLLSISPVSLERKAPRDQVLPAVKAIPGPLKTFTLRVPDSAEYKDADQAGMEEWCQQKEAALEVKRFDSDTDDFHVDEWEWAI
ncbi:hypothetical protein JCM6882_003477 [Rhodosporidiobolus microsporus]